MRNKKWQITAAIVALMIVGAFVAGAIARRGADDDARRAADAVQRWFRHHGGAEVRSCAVDARSGPNAPLYACQFVAGGCIHWQVFAIPVVDDQIDEHGVAAPLGQPKPRSC